MKISFIIPCYRSEKTITGVTEEILDVMKCVNMDYEIILVNDYSPDNVWNVIKGLSVNKNIKGISLARNFGQHAALMAGYREASGDIIVSLDDDGQTPVNELPVLLDEMKKGYDVVYAYYQDHSSVLRSLGTKMADKMTESLIGMPKGNRGSSFFVMRKFVKDEVIKYANSFPYLAGLVYRTTKNVSCVQLERRERIEGKSGYSLRKLFKVWFNGFSAFSAKPLEISFYIGTLFSFVGFVLAAIVIIRKINGTITLAGWSTVVSLILLIGGIILIMLGLIGEYVGRIYISLNNAPQYVVRDKTE